MLLFAALGWRLMVPVLRFQPQRSVQHSAPRESELALVRLKTARTLVEGLILDESVGGAEYAVFIDR